MGTNSNSVTTTELSYWLRVSDKDHVILFFDTKNLGATVQSSERELMSEVGAGITFNEIQNLMQLSAVISQGFTTAVHRLFTIPQNNGDLKINIDLMRVDTERHVDMGGDNIYTWHPEVVETKTEHSPARLILHKCRLLSMKPDGSDTYIASFKVNGSVMTGITPETS